MMYVLKFSFTITSLILKSQSNQFFAKLPYDTLAIGKCVVHDRQSTLISNTFPKPRAICLRECLRHAGLFLASHSKSGHADLAARYTDFAPKFNGRYLTSNVNITVFDENNNVVSVPLGSTWLSTVASRLHGSNFTMQVALPNLTPASMIYFLDVCCGGSLSAIDQGPESHGVWSALQFREQ